MRILRSGAEILCYTEGLEELIEAAGRVCWKSEERIAPGSAAKFIHMLKTKNHSSVLEHGSITVRFVLDRGIGNELVRHRIASMSQESTRYCAYNGDKFSNSVTFIDPRPSFPNEKTFEIWQKAMETAERYYFEMLEAGAKPEEARNVLPLSTKTEIVFSANPREWRHIFSMRASAAAHPQMREIMIPLLGKFAEKWPSIFGDLQKNA